jgi:ABC-2 type transport system permease protein
MSVTSNGVPEVDVHPQGSAPATVDPARTMYWCVRRELWENRSIYIAPLVVAAVILFGFVISTIGLPHRRRAALMLDAAHQRGVIERPFDIAAIMIIVTAFLVALFYCLDALYGERRDRSILFWKSLPVSDRITVLSKASIPFVVLPAVSFAIIVTTQFIMLMWSTMVLLPSGLAGTTWTNFNIIEHSFILLYGLIAIALWHAPIYGWLLLVSGWARRATLLWAVLPLLAISVLEKIAFNTSYFEALLKYRFIGVFTQAFGFQEHGKVAPTDPLSALTPINFILTPGLWVGLAFAAVFLVVAARLRRNREPI